MEWTIVTVIIALVGLFMTCAKPMISLQKSLTALELTIKALHQEFLKDEKILDDHEHRIQDHETRISILEASDE